MSRIVLEGLGTALVTPFQRGAVDGEALARLVEEQIQSGVDFLVPCGTTGESPTLTDEERVAVIEQVAELAAGRVPVVAGTGTNDTQHSVAMTRAAKKVGAHAALAVAPYYNRPTQEGIYRHFRAMIEEGGLPLLLYHIPARTGVGIEVSTVRRLVQAGGVLGIKESGGVERVTALRQEAGVSVLSGDDAMTLAMLALGGQGVVSVASNVVPTAVKAMLVAFSNGNLQEARTLHDRLSPLMRALFLEPNPTPIKAALQLTGLLSEDLPRLPLLAATPATRTAIQSALASLAEGLKVAR